MQIRESVRRFAARTALFGSLALGAVAAHAPAASAQLPVFPPEVTSYRLSTEGMQKFVAATNNLKALEGENIDLEDQIQPRDGEMPEVAQIAAAFDSEPRIRNAIGQAGLTSREYVTFLFAMIHTMFNAAMIEMGGENAFAQMQNGVLKDNVRFFREHKDEIERMAEQMDDDN
ncbi:MAG TPA: hypothetical protein VF665_24820 [Longimicrobium sp.]|uniref:hypothetical protein n=1 Tax=Longimicrobium sp. TaxID=2029185 RepID=UPI002ED7B7FF